MSFMAWLPGYHDPFRICPNLSTKRHVGLSRNPRVRRKTSPSSVMATKSSLEAAICWTSLRDDRAAMREPPDGSLALSLSPDPAPSVSACLQVLVWLWEVSLCFRSCRCQVPNIKLPCSLGKALGGSSWTVAQHPKQVWHTTTGPDIMMSKLLGRDLDDARET